MGDADDWVDKAEEERLGIIAKYDKGREEGVEIEEAWDDPGLEIYHVTDHYGFIHDKRFPLKLNPEESKFRLVEAERADKWIKMGLSWDKYKGSEKLRKRTFKGVPNKVRARYWGLFLDLPTIKEQQKGKYEEMYQLARKHSLDVRQIDLDVNRTYRDNVMFRERYGVKQHSLFNILCAYSIYNSEVGYCQGMSQVAALLLMYMDEEDAFWGLSQLMTHHKYGMHGFFIAGFPKLVRFQTHHDKVLKSMIPKLKKHFDKHGVDVGLYTLKWFFQCFLDRVPFELGLRLWDIFLMDGDKVLICGAYTILKMHTKQLLAKKSMDDLLDYLQSAIPSDITISNDKAIETYQRCLEDLQRKKLDVAGEVGEDELPKKPFGLIENIVKPVPIRKEQKRNSMRTVNTTPPPPVVKEQSECEYEESRCDVDGEEEDVSEKASASRITTGTSAASSTNSPRNFSRPLSSISNFSYTSAIEEYNSSNKSTPIKMNGVSGSSNKTKSTTGHVDSSRPRSGGGGYNNSWRDSKEEESIENGSVETVESVELVDSSQHIINVNQAMHFGYSEDVVKISMKGGKEIRASDKVVDGRSGGSSVSSSSGRTPPPPPARSLIMDSCKKPPVKMNYSTTIPVMERSSHHNGDGHKNMQQELDSSRHTKMVVCANDDSHSSRGSPSISDGPGWSSSSINIPSGAVRIHVPYTNSNSNDISTIPVSSSSPSSVATPRSNFDTLKNDPNRIKIDISSK